MATAKKAARKRAAKAPGQGAAKKSGAGAARSMPRAGKDPKGGLTAAGRRFFAEKEGSHLRPGVKGAADTPEKKKRKGSFLTRHFTHPRGPMQDEKGEPTRLALSAHAWGEPVPKTGAEAKRLAAKGRKLLEQFHKERGDPPKRGGAAAKRSKQPGKVAAKRASKGAARKRAGSQT